MEISTTVIKPGKRAWFVIYTRPRWEKKVNSLLQQQDIITYCPLRKVKNQWADRVKEVELPLFSCYIFVYINSKEELTVRSVYGVINFVCFMQKPASIGDAVIDGIRRCLAAFPQAEVINIRQLETGDRVRIKEGLMSHKEGQIMKLQGKNVLLIIDHLNCALITKIPVTALELI